MYSNCGYKIHVCISVKWILKFYQAHACSCVHIIMKTTYWSVCGCRIMSNTSYRYTDVKVYERYYMNTISKCSPSVFVSWFPTTQNGLLLPNASYWATGISLVSIVANITEWFLATCYIFLYNNLIISLLCTLFWAQTQIVQTLLSDVH